MPKGDNNQIALQASKKLISRNQLDDALDLLEGLPPSLLRDQQRALALSKLGRNDEAVELLTKLRDAGNHDAETNGILGGIYKRLWLAGNPGYLHSAYETYRETYLDTRDPYPGINAAALALQIKEPDESKQIATAILEELRAKEPALDQGRTGKLTEWDLATVGEAKLLLGEIEDARKWYRKAVTTDPRDVRNIATMRVQARLNLKALGFDGDELDDILHVPRVVAFTGHMTDAPDRPTVRFPEELVPAARAAVRSWLESLEAGQGFCSGARGGDLMFLDELLKRGGRAVVVLPFPPDDFVNTSVGPEWKSEFLRLIDDERVELHVLEDSMPPPDQQPAAYDKCNREIQERAVRFAESLGEAPVLLTVWNGEPGDGKGGTADAVRSWRRSGFEVEAVDVAELTEGSSVRRALDAFEQTRKAEAASPTKVETPLRFGYAHRYCLAIGIDKYEHWRPLGNAVNDAEDISTVLGRDFGFEVTPLFNERATMRRIRDEVIDGLRARAAKDDLVVIFFAGHGDTSETSGGKQTGYTVPVEARRGEDKYADLISMNEWAHWSTYLESRHVLYIFDSCFSGLIATRGGRSRRTHDLFSRNARYAIAAGGADQEVADGGLPNHSAFTGELIEALRGRAEFDAEGFLTASALFTYLVSAVPKAVPKNVQQTPAFGTLSGHGGGEILLSRPVEDQSSAAAK